MAESLLHASIVLSNEQHQSLRRIHPMYEVPKVIGVITFLGVDNVNKETVYLLIRFEPFAYNDSFMITTVIERLFGKKYELAFGNDVGMFGTYLLRVIITTKLREPLRNPERYTQTKAEAFAREIVNYQREKIRVHKEEEEEHWQSARFDLPEHV